MRLSYYRFTIGAYCSLLVALASQACKDSPTQLETDLETVRAATAFASPAAAATAGYNTDITQCMSDQHLGAMGFHVGNTTLLDATLQLEHPEVMLYEPTAGGGRTLVGVEFLVPYSAVPASAAAPEILGQPLKHNDTFQVWALHAWVHRDNPNGVFTDWNPAVSCAAAPVAPPMQH